MSALCGEGWTRWGSKRFVLSLPTGGGRLRASSDALTKDGPEARASKAFLLPLAHRLNDTRPRALEEGEGKAKSLLVLRCAIVVFSLACQPYAQRRDSAGSAVTKQQ
jgi:hypothetical protein